MFPILETERLLLREVQEKDAASLYSYFSKEEVIHYFGQPAFKQVDQSKSLIEAFRKTSEENRGIRWGIDVFPFKSKLFTIKKLGYYRNRKFNQLMMKRGQTCRMMN